MVGVKGGGANAHQFERDLWRRISKLVQGLPRGVLRDFDRERSEICGARAPSFFVWSFFRLCRSPLAFDASLFVNCCEFHQATP
jgi:hypothetical protein